MGKTLEKMGLGAGLAGGGFLAASYLGTCSGPGFEVEKQIRPVEGAEVVEVEPIALDCRAMTVGKFANSQALVNLKVLGLDVAADRKANTKGQVETLACVSGGAEIDDSDPKNVVVTVNGDRIQFRSRIVEDKTDTTFETDKLGDVTNIGAGIADIVGWNDIQSDYREIDSMLMKASRVEAVNHMQKECQEKAWPIVQRAIREAYGDQVMDKTNASKDEVDTPKVTVIFDKEPEYTKAYPMPTDFKRLNGEGTNFNQGKGDEYNCKIASDAYKGEYRVVGPRGQENDFHRHGHNRKSK